MFPQLLKLHVLFSKWHKHSFAIFQFFSNYTEEYYRVFQNIFQYQKNATCSHFFNLLGNIHL